MKNLAIIGSRSYNNYDIINYYVTELLKTTHINAIISGGAKGVDTIAELIAKNHNIEMIIYPADWKKYGKSAGFIRNKSIINNADIVFAFWNGVSPGTKHSINLAEKLNKELKIIQI